MDYKVKKEKIEKKYVNVIRAIAIANDVDLGIGYDMFKDNVMNGGKNPYVNMEEARKDFEELLNITK